MAKVGTKYQVVIELEARRRLGIEPGWEAVETVVDAVDTNVLVPYLLQDDAEMGPAAARLMDGGRRLGVSLVVLAETAFVLSRNYGAPREEVVDSLVGLLRKRNIEVLGAVKALVASDLLLCRPSGRVNYADALINADARTHEVGKLCTFDEWFPPEGLVLERPG